MRLARAAVIFSLGFFAIAAQSLLFRQFLTAFEGNELAIGVFFCSWLLWVTVGAWLARAVPPLAAALSGRFRGIALLYLPAFVVQYMLVGQARELAGVAPYEQFPLLAMIGVCVAANSPVSLLTGALFTWACRWAAGAGDGSPDAALTPARVYMLEALGAAAGGVWATLWLARGVPVETVFLLSAIVVAAAGLQPNLGGLARAAGVAALALAVAFGAGDLWSAHSNQRQWRRLIPAGYEGRVSTAQAEYLYGEHDGQFTVMAWGSVCETPFTLSQGAEDAAAILPQCPHARRVLVLGAGVYPLCTVLCSLPQIEQVAWFHPDPAYPPALAHVLREHGHPLPEKLEPHGSDARVHLQNAAGQYDLVILSLPETTTLVLNRYSTAEFFSAVKRALNPDGVVATRVPGGANYLASESAFLGLSMMATLETAFENTALKPGESSWFFASGGGLMSAPMPLARRWQGIDGAESWYPAEGVRDFYRRGRVAQQFDAYQAARASVPSDILVNTDLNPRALLFGILLELRRAGLRPAEIVPPLLLSGAYLMAAALLAGAASRLVFLIRHGGSGNPAVLDTNVLIATTGLASMALTTVLLFFYQTRQGGLFLHIGLIAALVMLGAWAGSLLVGRILARRRSESRWIVLGILAIHALALGLLAWMGPDASVWLFLAAFFLCGMLTGAYFPAGALRLADAGQSPDASGARLEAFDHLGGAAGAALTGLLFLPFFGTPRTLALLAGCLALNVPPLLLGRRARRVGSIAGDGFDRAVRPVAYTLTTLAALALAASNIFSAFGATQESAQLLDEVRLLAGPDAPLESVSATLSDGTAFTYFKETGPEGETAGYLFATDALAGDVYGYGGPLVLAVSVDPGGIVRDYRILHSLETPVYLDFVQSWHEKLIGKNIFEAQAFAQVDALSGATLTCNALMAALEQAGHRFAAEVLGKSVAPVSPGRRFTGEWTGLAWLAGLSLAAIFARRRPNPWVRRAILVTALLACGWYFNVQYSTLQAASLAAGALPPWTLSAPIFLVLALPLLTLLFGNFYCGYLCPFGAAQEVMEEVTRGVLVAETSKELWRYARAVKYLLLFMLALLYAVYRDGAVLQADPLITIFSGMPGRFVFYLGLGALTLSLVFRRFWCRNLCPAGAFLSLCNGVRVFRRLRPPVQPAKCPLGVRDGTEFDCICCDRCRHESH